MLDLFYRFNLSNKWIQVDNKFEVLPLKSLGHLKESINERTSLDVLWEWTAVKAHGVRKRTLMATMIILRTLTGIYSWTRAVPPVMSTSSYIKISGFLGVRHSTAMLVRALQQLFLQFRPIISDQESSGMGHSFCQTEVGRFLRGLVIPVVPEIKEKIIMKKNK